MSSWLNSLQHATVTDNSTLALSAFSTRNSFEISVQDGVKYTVQAALAKDVHYTLFRWEDWPAWVIFTTVFSVLIILDNVLLSRNPKALTISSAIVYTLFWVFCAMCFCGWVYTWYGPNESFMWMSGYMLEWMLSFDNLFVFHLIFSVYGTPDHLKHRPLYLGICGAVVFRLVFIFVGEYLMHAMFFMHILFGGFLVYTGVKTVTAADDDEDPSQHWAVQWLQQRLPFVSAYDDRGHFFVRVPVDDNGKPMVSALNTPEVPDRAPGQEEESDEVPHYGSIDFAQHVHKSRKTELRATMLFLVVLCIEISDLMFAVDSVSAIVAQVNDLFLAYTSAVFAMLGLRATFFIIDVLVRLFSLLKYGVSAVLIFIGIKLVIGKLWHIPPSIVCAVLVTAIAGSMVASWVQDELQKKADGCMETDVEARVAKVTDHVGVTTAIIVDAKPGYGCKASA
mmetsp:Transcript_15713/g.28613  ORF Transcript_15713/g.28613 Transcript_15713/m.28613 type:complete len:451 (+) Transcript_15713:148-1500(+)